jgi:hypothetical protein
MSKATVGFEFYDLLFKSNEFCAELGRMTLAASQLEALLILLLKQKTVVQKIDGAPLGRLIKIARENGLLDQNELSWLDDLSAQRNYLTHNIYALFICLIEETRLERSNLVDSDVSTYTERVWQLRENLLCLASIVAKGLA